MLQNSIQKIIVKSCLSGYLLEVSYLTEAAVSSQFQLAKEFRLRKWYNVSQYSKVRYENPEKIYLFKVNNSNTGK